MAKTRPWSEGLWSTRPQFLVGFFFGICLSSAAVQGILFYFGLPGGLVGGHTPPPPAPHPATSHRLSDYEVHNLGLKLRSASDDNMADSHVVKYFAEGEETLGGVDHYDSLPGVEEAGSGAGGGRTVYAGVLTSRERLSDHSAVVRMTWGAELTTVQFFYDTGGERADRVRRDHTREVVGLPGVGPSDVFTARHTAETLRHVCARHQGAYPWYVLLKDATYVHTSGLLRMLDRLSPSEDLIIGERDSAHDGVCSASPGIIFSSRALSRVCTRLDKCAGAKNVEQCIGMQCISSKKISPDLHVTPSGGHVVDVTRMAAGSRLSDQSVFVGPLVDTRDVYRLHLHYTRARIARTQHEITRLAQELSRTRRSVRPKRDRSLVRVQETAVFGADVLVNRTTDPLYQFIDQAGHLYLDSCKVRTQDVGREALSPYREALTLARAALEEGERQGVGGGEGLEYFTYKVTKPNLGVEYQFYFLQTLPPPTAPPVGHRGRPPRQKVHQVTVLQPYDRLEVESKEIQALRTVHFVVPMAGGSAEALHRFLLNYEAVCLSGGGVNINGDGGGGDGGGGDGRGGEGGVGDGGGKGSDGGGNKGLTDRCALLIVVYKQTNKDGPKDPRASEDRTARDVKRALSAMSERYPGAIHHVLEVAGESLTLARTVQMADSAFDRDDLLAVLPPDVTFTEDFLFRCQLNARPMKRAYFPVVYQRWGDAPQPVAQGPSAAHTLHGAPHGEEGVGTEGYWANADFSTFCAYNEDVQLFDNLPSSHRDLHNMFKASEYMGVFRAPDPGLSRLWRGQVCDMSNSADRQTCMRELKYINMQ